MALPFFLVNFCFLGQRKPMQGNRRPEKKGRAGWCWEKTNQHWTQALATSLWSHLLSHADSRGYRSARAWAAIAASVPGLVLFPSLSPREREETPAPSSSALFFHFLILLEENKIQNEKVKEKEKDEDERRKISLYWSSLRLRKQFPKGASRRFFCELLHVGSVFFH